MGGWIDMFRSLGESLLEVVRAELQTLQEDLTRSGRHLGMALSFLGVALILLFWLLGLLITLFIALLCIWLQFWASTLIVLLLFTAGTGFLVWRGLKEMRKVESPVETFRRHADDHLDWWQNNLLRENRPLDVEPTTTAGLPGGLYDEEEDLP
jgi:Zn-dependent protease with chaperone function